jgi:uncharacterized protein (UPF0303 family)
MSIADDLEQIARQESTLQFIRFDNEIAWRLGSGLHRMAVARGHAVVIDVRRFGQQLFFSALDGTTPDNAEWVRRKTNTVARFLRSRSSRNKATSVRNTHSLRRIMLPTAEVFPSRLWEWVSLVQ